MSTTPVPIHIVAGAAGAVAAASVGHAVSSSELNAVEGKLSLMLHAVETHYESDLAKAKLGLSTLKAHWGKLLVSHTGVAAAAVALAKHFL